MKKIFYLLLLSVSFSFANNTYPLTTSESEPKIGDVLIINSTSNIKYNHIEFPRLNVIAKRGHGTNYKSVHGKRVVIKEIVSNKHGNTQVRIENEDQSKFFGYLTQVEANYTKSISSGEMSIVTQ